LTAWYAVRQASVATAACGGVTPGNASVEVLPFRWTPMYLQARALPLDTVWPRMERRIHLRRCPDREYSVMSKMIIK
jgi:hypothetical protein